MYTINIDIEYQWRPEEVNTCVITLISTLVIRLLSRHPSRHPSRHSCRHSAACKCDVFTPTPVTCSCLVGRRLGLLIQVMGPV